MRAQIKIKWNERGVRQLEQQLEARLGELARQHKGASDDEIRRALAAAGLSDIRPELVEMIRAGEHPPARFRR
ncbi:MAG TPA: hypothetical protein VF230_00440 [Acidimicrobiales bacterium]